MTTNPQIVRIPVPGQPSIVRLIVPGAGSLIGAQGPAGPAGPAGAKGDPGEGVPAGGTTGQLLAKMSSANYVTGWIDPPTGGGGEGGGGGSAAATTFIPQGDLSATTVQAALEELDAEKSPLIHEHLWADITDRPTVWPWESITGVPATFTPSAHTHVWGDITGVPATFTPSAHTHLWADITDKPATWAWGSLTGVPTTFTPSAHTHAWADITDKPTTWAWGSLTGVPTTFTPSAHTHAWADITGEPTTLAGYGITDAAPLSHVGTGGAAHANVVAAGAAGFMTGADKTKLDGIAAGANNYVHPTTDGNRHVPATAAGDVNKVLKAASSAGAAPAWTSLAKGDVGLGNVDNTADADKPISTAVQTALNGKANSTHVHSDATTSVSGFMSTADKTKLDGIASGANNYSHPSGDGNLHVPATGTTNSGRVLTAGATAGSLSWAQIPAQDWSAITNKPTTFAPSAHAHVWADITDRPTTWAWGNITGVPGELVRRVLDRDRGGPPAGPIEGDTYIVRSVPAPTGAWVGQGGKLARWSGSAWTFETPANGTVALVVDENRLLSWDGTTWDSFIKVGKPGGVSVAEFGAYPDGQDCITQIQAAQAFARTNGLRLIIPFNEASFYLVSSPIVLTERDHIESAGAWASAQIRYTGQSAFRIEARRTELSGFHINGVSSAHADPTGIYLANTAITAGTMQFVKLSRMWFQNNKFNILDEATGPTINTVEFEDLIDTGRALGGAGLRLQNVSGSINLARIRFNQALGETGTSYGFWITGGGGVFMDDCSAIGGFNAGAGLNQGGILIENSSVFTAKALNCENLGGVPLRLLKASFVNIINSHFGASNGDGLVITDGAVVRMRDIRIRGNRAEVGHELTSKGLVIEGTAADVQIHSPRIWETASHAIDVASGVIRAEIHDPVIAKSHVLDAQGSVVATVTTGGIGIHNRSPDLILRGGRLADCDGKLIDSSGGLDGRDVRLSASTGNFYDLGAGDVLEDWRDEATRARWNSYGPETY